MRKINFTSLQKKKWYIYLKIAYLSIFIISLAVVIIDSTKILTPKFDPINSYILCDNGTRYTLGQQNLKIASQNALQSADDLTAKRLCISDERLGELARASISGLPDAELSDKDLGAKIKSSRDFVYQNFYLLITPANTNYSVVEVYIRSSFGEVLTWILIPTVLLIIIFEVELRIFYYLVLGKFFPERPSCYLFFKTRH